MPIIFHNKEKVFHLFNNEISYIFKVLKNGELGQLYFGKQLTDSENFTYLFQGASRDMSAYVYEGDSTFSMENIKQEYPAFGHGDMRYPAFQILRENGSNIVEFVYHSHKIYPGKPLLEGLPATYAENAEEAVTLEITLRDAQINVTIILLYTLFEHLPVITRSTRFECGNTEDITLQKAMSGCSSYQFNPFLALKKKNASEYIGEVLGFSLIYSGSFLGQVEVDNYDVTRVVMGIHPDTFNWKLGKGETFQTPEMVLVYSDSGISKMSQLFRAHPEWVLGELERSLCHSRNQYILDLSKQEVRDYIFSMLENLFDNVPVSYIKWDMNRTFSEIYSNGNDKEYQGKVSHKYILGVYELYERMITRFPNIMFEACASGGARFDPGILYYAPLGWISDNTDAVDRLKIQYGTSLVYPLASMGSHVSPSPNHQNGRITSLEMRGNVALFGTFGYELDLGNLSTHEKEIVRRQIKFMKRFRNLIHSGTFYRLLSPFEGNETAWIVVSEDQREALAAYYRVLNPVNIGFKHLKLAGLNPKSCYHIDGCSRTYYGDELMYLGMDISDYSSGNRTEETEPGGDFISKIYHLQIKI